MLIDKNNLPLVAEDFMNDVHFEDVEIINRLHKAAINYKHDKTENNKQEIIKTYEEWFEHTVNHFKGEEEKMLETRFPPYYMHQGEHERCLDHMNYVLENFKLSGNETLLLEYLEVDLINWLVNHIQTMDTVTAMFFKTGLSPCSMH